MADISELKNAVDTKTLTLVLLSVATAGVYLILYIGQHTRTIESVVDKKVGDHAFVVWVAVCFGLGTYFEPLVPSLPGLFLIVLALQIAYVVLLVVWAFKARTVLQEYALTEHKVDLRMNAFYTFLFTVFYVNYCINDLPEDERKQRILDTRRS